MQAVKQVYGGHTKILNIQRVKNKFLFCITFLISLSILVYAVEGGEWCLILKHHIHTRIHTVHTHDKKLIQTYIHDGEKLIAKK